MRVVFSARARTDLRDIAFYIAGDNKSRAQSFVLELREKARDLARNSRAFPVVPSLERHQIRRRVHRGYLIFYRVDEDAVRIVRILHGARDYDALF